MSVKLLLPVLCAAQFALITGEAGFSQDSYTDALQNSHQTNIDNNGGGYNYVPPNNNYLPPAAPVYGPPAPAYGPPPNFYNPLPLPHSHPRDHWLLHKIKTKINLFTIGKILLKLIIFKKIVKFIAIICLLLFLPKLKDMFKDDTSMDEDDLESKQVESDRDILEKRIDEVYDFFLKSIESFGGTKIKP